MSKCVSVCKMFDGFKTVGNDMKSKIKVFLPK